MLPAPSLELALSSAWFVAAVWLITRAWRQRRLLPVATALPPPAEAPGITVVVPARDEATQIGACLDSLLAQTYPAERLRIIVVDDESQDATAEIVAAYAARERRITLLRSRELPSGWIGKSHACAVGARQAAGSDWLCFIDADVRAEPALLSSALGTADQHRLDLLSLAPKQELGSFAERLILPCGLYLLGFIQNLKQLQSPDSADAVATGQFMLVRQRSYVTAGGHAAVSYVICEDQALARRVKRTGGRVALFGGQNLLRARMYCGWRTLWPGFAKNLVDTLGGPVATVAIAAIGPNLAWAAPILPALDAFSCAQGQPQGCIALSLALPASAAAFGLHLAGAAALGIPFWYGLLFPLGYSAGAVLALDSLRRRIAGRVFWKGRTYSSAASSGPANSASAGH